MHKKLILLINGNQVLMELNRKILEREGYSVRCAVGLAGAKEYLVDFTPDGIILENDLSDGIGLDFCQELRKQSAIPVMLLSNAKEDELPALQAGATDFLKKPYDNDIMIARIGVMLNTKFSAVQTAGGAENAQAFQKKEPATQNVPLTQLNEAAVPTKSKRLPKIWRYGIATAACAMLVFLCTMVFNANGGNMLYTEIPDDQVPLTGAPLQMDKNAKPYLGPEQGGSFPHIDTITIPADETNVNMLLINHKDNPCYFTFEIILVGTGESLYSSDAVAPGACIEEITFARKLAKGEHTANLEICAYSLEDYTAMGSSIVKFQLTAY